MPVIKNKHINNDNSNNSENNSTRLSISFKAVDRYHSLLSDQKKYTA